MMTAAMESQPCCVSIDSLSVTVTTSATSQPNYVPSGDKLVTMTTNTRSQSCHVPCDDTPVTYNVDGTLTVACRSSMAIRTVDNAGSLALVTCQVYWHLGLVSMKYAQFYT